MDFFNNTSNFLSDDNQKIYEFRLQYCKNPSDVFSLLLEFFPPNVMPMDFIKHIAIEEFNKLIENSSDSLR